MFVFERRLPQPQLLLLLLLPLVALKLLHMNHSEMNLFPGFSLSLSLLSHKSTLTDSDLKSFAPNYL